MMIDTPLIIQLFVLLNPLSSFPFLMAAFRKGMNVRVLAVSATITAYVIAVSIALAGPFLFRVFGISLESFRIAGGIILLLLGIDTIRAQDEEVQEVGGVDSLISIIATPLLTGPATMSFITIKSYEIPLIHLLSNISLAFFFVGLVFFMFSYTLPRVNGKLVNIISKVLGLFLTAMAIEMIANGLSGTIIAALKHR